MCDYDIPTLEYTRRRVGAPVDVMDRKKKKKISI